MGGIYRRKNKLWLWYFNASGKRVFEATSCRPGEEARARELLQTIERQVEAGERLELPPESLTVKAYGERWMKGRAGQGVVTHEDEARRLRLHAWPLLGDVLLKDLRPHHVRDMVRALRVKKSNRGGTLAPRTVRHVAGTLHTLMHDAVVDELIMSNPVVFRRGELPGKVDKDPSWRDGAVFTREEVERLISDPLIPEDRRVWHAVLFLTGLRFGEAAALRWRHYDAGAEPLGRLSIVRSWNSETGEEGTTKTERPRVVPVHATLAKVLAAWKLGGYERTHGKKPGDDDLVTPNRDGEHKNPRRALLAFHRDLLELGLRKRRQHDTRRTFQSLARADSGRTDLIDWVVHGPSGDMADAYTTFPFEHLADAVSKLRIELRTGQLLALPSKQVVGAGACDTACDTETPETKKPPTRERLKAHFEARSRGLEGAETSRPSPVVEGNRPEFLSAADSEVGPHGSSAEAGVTVSHGEIAERLRAALTAWEASGDVDRLTADLGALSIVLRQLRKPEGQS